MKFFGWHPGNRQIVYWDGANIMLLDIFKDEPTLAAQPQLWGNLPYPPLVDSAAFSPDGQRLIVSYTLTGSGGEVWILNADGSEPRRLFGAASRFSLFAWSPDGRAIAFAGDGVEVMSSDGQNRRAMGSGIVGGAVPVWSPDSRYLAFTSAETWGYVIRIVDVIGGTAWNLINDTNRSDVLPAWSPDGSQLIFLGGWWNDEQGASEVWVANLDGTGLRQLTSDGHPKRSAAIWVPAWPEQ